MGMQGLETLMLGKRVKWAASAYGRDISVTENSGENSEGTQGASSRPSMGRR